MSVPPYFPKAAAGVAGAIGDITADTLAARLADVRIELSIDDHLADRPTHALGLSTVANLLGRLYPNVTITAPNELADRVRATLRDVNPDCTLDDTVAPTVVRYRWGSPGGDCHVSSCARGWSALIDAPLEEPDDPAAAAALAAAALGANEIFRTVFADELASNGRHSPTPFAVNVLTLDDRDAAVDWPIDIGRVHLAGAGAVGQAALLTLRESDVTGTIIVVDPEDVDDTNLQRYVLTRVGDVDVPKTALAVERTTRAGLHLEVIPSAWNLAAGAGAERVLCALDSARARREVQATLPGAVYNAYTSFDDVGWSRHERFGTDPCLACLYWPKDSGKTRAEQIAEAIGIHPLRATYYLVDPRPVSQPADPAKLAGIAIAPDLRDAWASRSILDDLAETTGIDSCGLEAWKDRCLEDLYREGVCGGALLGITGGRPTLVPLAHESLLAGVFLAVQVIAASDDTLRRLRPSDVEGRWNLRAGPTAVYPRQPTRKHGCICNDNYFLDALAGRS